MDIPKANKIDIEQFIADAIINSGRRLCFILGSGASVSSGIPTGGELEMKWMDYIMSQSDQYQAATRATAKELHDEKRLDHDFEAIEKAWRTAKSAGKGTLPGEYYFDLYALRFRNVPGGGVQELQDCMRGCVPSLGYFVLAQLMTFDNCRNNVVVTTNFDGLVEKALYSFTDETPVTVPHENLLESFSWDGKYPVVAKVHRDLMFSPLNSTREVKALKKGWKTLLRRVFDDYVPIVIGYAGADDSLMRFMEENDTKFRHGLYWCYREKGAPPDDRVIRLIKRKGGFLVPIEGFDELMVRISLYQGSNGNPIGSDFVSKLEKHSKETAKKYRQALKTIERKINADKPDTAFAFFNRAYRLAEERKYPEAIEGYTEAIRLDPDDAVAYNNRGSAYDNSGDYKAAIADYNKAIELKPDFAEAYYNRGNAYSDSGDHKAAIADYNKAIELNPNYSKAYNNRGTAYDNLRDYKTAIADYNEAIELKPDYAMAYRNRGNTYKRMGNDSAAAADFAKARELEAKS